MASIYDYNTSNVALNLSPFRYRKTRWQAFFRSLLWPLQWLRDNWFNEYKTGSVAPLFSTLIAYPKGYRVTDPSNNAVYESNEAQGPGAAAPVENLGTWSLVSPDYRGVDERLKYNSQKLMLEYILNKFFRCNFTQPPQATLPDIYIENNLLNNFAFVAQDDSELASDVFGLDQFTQQWVIDDYDFVSYAFTIWVKLSVFNDNLPDAEAKIRAVADRYVIAGIKYNVLTY